MPRYHATLGSSTGTLSLSNPSIQRLLCWSNVCDVDLWGAYRTFRKIISILFLWSSRNSMVTIFSLAIYRRKIRISFNFRYLSWLWLVFEKPAYHTCIDTKELLFIENSLGGGEVQSKYTAPTLTNTPWKQFFTSLPCYAIFIANFCRSWNFYLLVLFQTAMFKDCFEAALTEVSFFRCNLKSSSREPNGAVI